jgi:hypothetical protein
MGDSADCGALSQETIVVSTTGKYLENYLSVVKPRETGTSKIF